jgi:hypothetical protein
LWKSALENIDITDESSIVFLSGRYTLNEHFKDQMLADYAFKMENSWAGDELKLFHTSCFKVKGCCKKHFLAALEQSKFFIKKTGLDIEHTLYEMLKKQNIEYLTHVECYGYLGSGNGKNV